MKLIKSLLENDSFTVDGFHLDQHEEREDDNIKIWHTVTTPSGVKINLDNSPYERIRPNEFKWYVEFYKKYNRFPSRKDIKSIGPLHTVDVKALLHNDFKNVKENINEDTITQFNTQDPMNPEIQVQGVGRYTLKQAKENIRRKFEDMHKTIEGTDDPYKWKQAAWMLDHDGMRAIMQAITAAHDELQGIRQKGGTKSKGIIKHD